MAGIEEPQAPAAPPASPPLSAAVDVGAQQAST
jgi:hypothetical protein